MNKTKKFILGIVVGMVLSGISAYIVAGLVISKKFSYKNKEQLEGNTHSVAYTTIDAKVSDVESALLNRVHPIGSIFLSSTLSDTTAVHNAIGGTWEVFGAGRILISANSTYPINTTGGAATHQHKYGMQFAGYYRSVLMESVADAGVLNYSNATSYTIPAQTISITASNATAIAANTSTKGTISSANLQANRYVSIGNTGTASSLPPYITVYMYKRTG